MPVALNPVQETINKIDEEILSVMRRKLVTIVEPGASDKVIFVEPYDLGKNDPEGLEEVIEMEVVDTNYDQGYALHKTKRVKTGRFQKRHELNPQKFSGPFGPTYRIDTSNQDGKREWEDFKRVLDSHVSRHQRVPEPVPYHSDVTEQGMMDLRNRTIEVADVPVVVLENYGPLQKLLQRKNAILQSNGMAPQEAPDAEAEMVAGAQPSIVKCKDCDFITKDTRSLGIHSTKVHGRSE